MRRLFDLVFAALACVVGLPIFCLVAIAVWIMLGRPLFFAQTRAGLAGRPFTIIKFRSMRSIGPEQGRLADEERIDRFGRLLRRSRLDELPEFGNILAGDMSVIGPRPLLPDTIARMGLAGTRRGRVRPGLTGWAQINGNTALTDEEKVSLDLWYIEHRTWRLDAIILVRTALMMIFGEKRNERFLAKMRPPHPR